MCVENYSILTDGAFSSVVRCSGLINSSCVTELYCPPLVHASIHFVLIYASTKCNALVFRGFTLILCCSET